jgi:hypothetical protein
MLGTILAVIVAFITIFFQNFFSINPQILDWIIFSSIFLILALFGVSLAFAFSPLQKVEQNFTPRLLEMFRQDKQIRLTWYWTLFFVMGSLLLIVAVDEVREDYLFAGWIVALGISLDAHRHMLMRIFNYFNPFEVVKMFTDEAIVSIQNENEDRLTNSIDALSEVAVKSIDRSSFSLCQHAVDEMRNVAYSVLRSAKSLSHPNAEKTEERVSFTLFYLFQRLELIHAMALDHGFEPISTNLINNLGKIAVEAAKCDISYVVYPLHYMGKFAREGQDEGYQEIGVRASIALIEVARRLVGEVDLSYASIREPFFTLIGQLEEITKEMFRQDKETNILFLKQPFLDLRKIFEQEKIASHQDTPAIRADIDRVLDEFGQLEAIMQQMPPIPEVNLA